MGRKCYIGRGYVYIKKRKREQPMSFYPLFTLEKNKYNIWKKSCQYSISQDTEGGNSTCREKVGKLARKLNPPHIHILQ